MADNTNGVATRGYWWVNHRHKSLKEIAGGYLWCPKRNKSGGRNPTYDNMSRVAPGDVVFSHASGSVGALGVALDRVRSGPAPVGLELEAGEWQPDLGWLLPVRFEVLEHALVVKGHAARLARTLPRKHSPLRASGKEIPGAYLAEVPAPMAALLGELLQGQLERILEQVAIETGDELTDRAAEERIWRRADLTPHEKQQLVSARLGHGSFRRNVEQLETTCRVTGVLDRRHLRATHIKPWRISNDREMLDGHNGLILSPHIEQLFVRGHISFTNDGRLLISEHMNPTVTRAWGLDRARPPRPFRSEQWVYLDVHRQQVFEKAASGRRALAAEERNVGQHAAGPRPAG